MTCPNCGQWMTTTGPAHVCPWKSITIPLEGAQCMRLAVNDTEEEITVLRHRTEVAEHQRDDALARLAEAERDAKRYRFVRDKCSIQGMGAFWYGDAQSGFIAEVRSNGPPWRELRGPDDIDRVIDAAMGEGR